MDIPPGDYDLSHDNGQLLIRTHTEGPAAAMGHNLTIEVDYWSGQVTIGTTPADSQVQVTADLRHLTVVGGAGGAKPLTEADKPKILANAAKALEPERFPELSFASSAIDGTWDSGSVTGELTVHGVTGPVELRLDQPEQGVLRLAGTIRQSDFGVRPFSTMMGALKLTDGVDIEVSIPFA